MISGMRYKTVPLLGLVLLVMATLACSSLTPEEALTQRAELHAEFMNSANWDKTYDYLSPRFRKVCAKSDHRELNLMGYSVLKQMLGLSQDTQITSSVTRIEVDGDVGRVFHEVQPAEATLSGPGEHWVYVDDEWWYENDKSDWKEGCEISEGWYWDEKEGKWGIRSD
jgi:hypothetical protein